MKIFYRKLARITIGFPSSEAQAAIGTFRAVAAYLKRDLDIKFKREEDYTSFYLTDMEEALAVLKGLATYFNADFIWGVAKQLEDDLHPKPKKTAKLLVHVNHFHLCEECAMEVDDRKPDCYRTETLGWRHIVCPELKPKPDEPLAPGSPHQPEG